METGGDGDSGTENQAVVDLSLPRGVDINIIYPSFDDHLAKKGFLRIRHNTTVLPH